MNPVPGYKFGLKNLSGWLNRGIVLMLWLLLFGVFLFSLFNIAVYLLVPVDGAVVWVRQGPVRVTGAPATGTGRSSLQQDDIILKIQGQSLDWWLSQRWQTLPRLLQRFNQPNPTTQMTVQRNAQTMTLDVPLRRHPGGAAAGQFFTHMIVGYAFLLAGAIILKGRGSATVERVAVLLMVLLALVEQNEILLVLGAEWAWSTLWLFFPLRLITRWFAYSFTLHFSLLFPHPKPWLKRVPYLPLFIHLLNPAVTLGIMLNTPGNLQQQHAAAYSPSKDIYIFFLLLACIFLVHSYITARDIVAKNQLRWIAWGAVMATVPNVLLADLSFLVLGYKLLPPEFSTLLLLFIPVVVAVAILHYRLWDIELIIRASLLYGALTVLLGAVYLALASLFIALLGATAISNRNANNTATAFFFSAMAVALLFAPARDYVQRGIDRIFFRSKLDYPHLLTSLSRKLATSLIFEDLLKLLNETIPEHLGLRGGKVLLNTAPPPGSSEYQNLIQGRLVWLQDIQQTSPADLPPPLDQMRQSGLWACLPLLSGDELLGLYGLGKKKSGDYYNREEIALLETLARQAGVALQNARLHDKLAGQVRIQRDLEIAHQIQLSMLPRQDPLMPGLEVVSFSRPAQEVGGDFYHYFKFDRQRLGIAVGDVSGKGVPAALFMAVSISTLRAQVPHYRENTAALLAAINNILYPQMIVSDVNTALLYATIEQNSGNRLKFRVSNAGLIWPILRHNGGQIEYINACGLPIGTFANANYTEFYHELLPGDLVILCSDGLVEAMNRNQEIFGFERLEQSLAACGDDFSAGAVLEYLRQELVAFVGNAQPHDDMTMLAIRVLPAP